jgi:hypothetical protein
MKEKQFQQKTERKSKPVPVVVPEQETSLAENVLYQTSESARFGRLGTINPVSALASGVANSGMNMREFSSNPYSKLSSQNIYSELASQSSVKTLAVSSPNDKEERQADALAQKIVGPQSRAQRWVQGPTPILPDGFESKVKGTRGKGRPLDGKTKDLVETHTGWDLDGVMVHEYSEAVELSDEINARSFTYGLDIYGDTSSLDPNTREGQLRLVEEVIHTQQPSGALIKRDPGDDNDPEEEKEPSLTLHVVFGEKISGANKDKKAAFYAIKELHSVLGVNMSDAAFKIHVEGTWSWSLKKDYEEGDELTTHVSRTKVESELTRLKYSPEHIAMTMANLFSESSGHNKFYHWVYTRANPDAPVEYDFFLRHVGALLYDNEIYQAHQALPHVRDFIANYLFGIDHDFTQIDYPTLLEVVQTLVSMGELDVQFYNYEVSPGGGEFTLEGYLTSLKDFKENKDDVIESKGLYEEYRKLAAQKHILQTGESLGDFDESYGLNQGQKDVLILDTRINQLLLAAYMEGLLSERLLTAYHLAVQDVFYVTNNIDRSFINEFGVREEQDSIEMARKSLVAFYRTYETEYWDVIYAESSSPAFVWDLKTFTLIKDQFARTHINEKVTLVKGADGTSSWTSVIEMFKDDVVVMFNNMADKITKKARGDGDRQEHMESLANNIKASGLIRENIMKVLQKHPHATSVERIPAMFFPEVDDKDGKRSDAFATDGIPWYFYLVKERLASGKDSYTLYDVVRTDILHTEAVEVDASLSEYQKMQKVNTEFRSKVSKSSWLSAGLLYYDFPTQATKVVSCGNMSFGDWLKVIGYVVGAVVLILVGIAFYATAIGAPIGAGMWITAGAMISAAFILAGVGFKLSEMSSIGVDDNKAYFLEILEGIIAAATLGSTIGTVVGKLVVGANVGKFGLLAAKGLDYMILPLEITALAGDVVFLVAITPDVAAQIAHFSESDDPNASWNLFKVIGMALANLALFKMSFKGGRKNIKAHLKNGGFIHLDVGANGKLIAKLSANNRVGFGHVEQPGGGRNRSNDSRGKKTSVEDSMDAFADVYHHQDAADVRAYVEADPNAHSFVKRNGTRGLEALHLAGGNVADARKIMASFSAKTFSGGHLFKLIKDKSLANKVRDIILRKYTVRVVASNYQKGAAAAYTKQGYTVSKTDIDGVQLAKNEYGEVIAIVSNAKYKAWTGEVLNFRYETGSANLSPHLKGVVGEDADLGARLHQDMEQRLEYEDVDFNPAAREKALKEYYQEYDKLKSKQAVEIYLEYKNNSELRRNINGDKNYRKIDSVAEIANALANPKFNSFENLVMLNNHYKTRALRAEFEATFLNKKNGDLTKQLKDYRAIQKIDPIKAQIALNKLERALKAREFRDSLEADGFFSPKDTVRGTKSWHMVQSTNIRPAKITAGTKRRMRVDDIVGMQDSIGNFSGGYWVLHNALLLSRGKTIGTSDIKVWYNLAEGAQGWWTVDHRRLYAYKLGGKEYIDVEYISMKELTQDRNLRKMTTDTGGEDIILRVGFDANRKFVDPKAAKAARIKYTIEKWSLKDSGDGTWVIRNEDGEIIKLEEIEIYLPPKENP